jgi:hypothetical protein
LEKFQCRAPPSHTIDTVNSRANPYFPDVYHSVSWNYQLLRVERVPVAVINPNLVLMALQKLVIFSNLADDAASFQCGY